jgi:N-acetyl-gamma-glutamyl-phosphate reductase
MAGTARIGIVGATGYVGLELVRLLVGHGGFHLTELVSQNHVGKPFSEVHPAFRTLVDQPCTGLDADRLAERCDFVVTALPHGVSSALVPELLARGLRVLDHSGDFRFRDAAVYEAAYGLKHPRPDLLAEVAYGLPELYRDRIRTARIVANPGCYPTCTLLGLVPLLRAGAIDPATIVVDAASGISGAGRKADIPYLFTEAAESFKAYGVTGHRHLPEIEQELSAAAGVPVAVTFVPHLAPMKRGMLATIHAQVRPGSDGASLRRILSDAYASERFVRLLPEGVFPETRHATGTNFADLGLHFDTRTGRVVVLCAIDNLGKGAAAQALQALNLMAGFDEAEGLRLPALAL